MGNGSENEENQGGSNETQSGSRGPKGGDDGTIHKDALERMPEDVAKALEQALAEKEKLDRHSGDTRVPKGIMAEIERWMIRTTRANLGIREPRGQEHTVNDAIGRARESVGEIWETWRENFGREMRSDIARLIKQEIRPGSVDRPAGNGKTFRSQNQK